MTIKLNPAKLAVLFGISLPLMISTTPLQADTAPAAAAAATAPAAATAAASATAKAAATATAKASAPAKASAATKVPSKKTSKQDVGDKALDDIYNQN